MGVSGDTQVSLSWTAPSSNGGESITDYVVQYSSNSGSSWSTFADGTSTTTTATVTGLTNGSTYIFKVAAVNSVGTGAYSTSSTGVLVAGVPGAPTSVVGVSGDTQVSLSWTAPSSNGGESITDYVVQYSSNSGSSWSTFADGTSTTTTTTVTGLTNGSTYIFKVAAVNSVGTGAYSTSSTGVLVAGVPGAPTSVVGVSGDTQVSLSWTAPSSNGGASITDYVVQYSSNSGISWSTFTDGTSTTTTATVTGLTNGSSYTFRVSAVNDHGSGNYSEVSISSAPHANSWTSVHIVGVMDIPITIDASATLEIFTRTHYANVWEGESTTECGTNAADSYIYLLDSSDGVLASDDDNGMDRTIDGVVTPCNYYASYLSVSVSAGSYKIRASNYSTAIGWAITGDPYDLEYRIVYP